MPSTTAPSLDTHSDAMTKSTYSTDADATTTTHTNTAIAPHIPVSRQSAQLTKGSRAKRGPKKSKVEAAIAHINSVRYDAETVGTIGFAKRRGFAKDPFVSMFRSYISEVYNIVSKTGNSTTIALNTEAIKLIMDTIEEHVRQIFVAINDIVRAAQRTRGSEKDFMALSNLRQTVLTPEEVTKIANECMAKKARRDPTATPK